uniref:Adaptor related protein complex 1 sigma 3 subunit n=1 Tax=Gallus gallus TaxID=9031 RepID=A0A8V1A4Q6_CHICK
VRASAASGPDLELPTETLSLWKSHVLSASATYQQIPASGYRDLLLSWQSCSHPALSSSSGSKRGLAKPSHVRYASLYFCCAIEDQDNELLTLEVVHRYVELLDRYFGNVWNILFFCQVCELDIIFNFEKAYFILDEFIIGGEVQDTSKRSAVKAMEDSDMLQETVEEYMNKPAF